MFSVNWFYASRGRRLLRPDADPAIVSGVTRSYLPGPYIYLGATLVAFASPRASVSCSWRSRSSTSSRARSSAPTNPASRLRLMERSLPVAERPRRPEWMKVRAPSADSRYFDVRKLLHGASLNTICEEARCPNIAECWGRGTATFQILGDTCTRACRYCYVHSGKPDGPPDPLEPLRLAAAAAQMDLKHVVVTSVDRDDLPDRGAGHYAATIRALKRKLPDASIEILTPDFLGCEEEALSTVLAERPDVFNHNIETVRRLHARMRGAKASYDKALWLLRAREGGRGLPGADEVRDHRRPRRDERRGGRDDARPPRARRRRGDDRPVPAAQLEAREDRPLGASRRVPLVPRAGRGARLRLGLLRAARARAPTVRTSSATPPRPAAAPSRTELCGAALVLALALVLVPVAARDHDQAGAPSSRRAGTRCASRARGSFPGSASAIKVVAGSKRITPQAHRERSGLLRRHVQARARVRRADRHGERFTRQPGLRSRSPRSPAFSK